MKIINLYIIKTMLIYILAVMVIWLGIYAFFNFIEEVDKISQTGYTALNAITYVVFDLPAVAYSHSSVIILLGSIFALGHFATTSQLVIFQCSGLSVVQIAKIVISGALIFILIIAIMGETIAPRALEHAEQLRAKSLGQNIALKNQQGFWLKDNNNFISVGKNINSQVFKDVVLLKIVDNTNLVEVVKSDKASFNDNNFNMQDAKIHKLEKGDKFTKISNDYADKYTIDVTFNKKFIDSLEKKPYELSTWSLYKQIDFLINNNLAAGDFEVEFYKRLVKPMTLVAMILLSMLFVFGSLRDSSLSKKMFLGIMLSLLFELISRISGVVSLKFDYSPVLSAFLPSFIVLLFAIIMLNRKFVK